MGWYSDRLEQRRVAAKAITPYRDRFKDWLKIWFYRLAILVLLILLIKHGGDVGLGTDIN